MEYKKYELAFVNAINQQLDLCMVIAMATVDRFYVIDCVTGEVTLREASVLLNAEEWMGLLPDYLRSHDKYANTIVGNAILAKDAQMDVLSDLFWNKFDEQMKDSEYDSYYAIVKAEEHAMEILSQELLKQIKLDVKKRFKC